MTLILAYWLFLFFLVLPFGVVLQKGIKLKKTNACITLLLGLLLLTVSFTITAFFVPLGAYNLLFYLIVSIILYFFYRKKINEILLSFRKELYSLTLFYKSITVILLLGAALKSAQTPFVIDNESYYIQTIKWVNEYGLVKGLGNLHLFFAQASSWHILHAGLNLNFLGITFNDLNGFVFIICMLYYITESKNKIGWFSLLPVFSIMFFLFLDSPSPDLPILIITPVILHLYTQQPSEDNFKTGLLLLAFIAFIKITIAPLGLLFLPPLNNREKLLFFIKVTLVFAILWMVKNTIVSGYPLYPFTIIAIDADWTVPKSIIETINVIGTKDAYGVHGDTSWLKKITSWLQLSGIKGLLNILIIVLFTVMPFFKNIRENKSYRTIYIIFLIHFIILLFTSPQYRFFLPEIIFFSLFIANELLIKINNKVLYRIAIYTGVVLSTIPLFKVSFVSITATRYHQSNKRFSLNQFYKPEPITRYPNVKFKKIKSGNLEYFSPENDLFIFGTSNGFLPCINKAQVNYIEQKTGYIPQLRGQSLKDGFISIKTLRE